MKLSDELYIAYGTYNRRVTELLEANNKLVEENRMLRAALQKPVHLDRNMAIASLKVMVSAYEDARAKYIGKAVYYQNNQLAFEGAMLKAITAVLSPQRPVTDLYTFGSPDHPDRFIKRSDGTVIDTMEGM